MIIPIMLRPRFVLILIPITLILTAALALRFSFLPAWLQPPRVLQIEPANDSVEILSTSPITISFSAPMDRAQTETNVELAPHVTGQFSWRDNQTLVFTPRPSLPISTTLTVNISGNARSWLQRPLLNESSSRFSTLTRPYPVSSAPALDAQFVYVPNHVTISFNRAMDGNALADSLEIEPPLQNSALDIQDRTLTLSGFFALKTHYQITISGLVFDKEYGIAMDRNYIWSFTTASQYPNLSILNPGRVSKFPAAQAPVIPTQFTNVSRLDVALYAIPRREFDVNAGAPFEAWYAFRPATAPIQQSRIETNAKLDTYTLQTLPLDPLPAGTYYLKLTSPEGVSDAQLLLVE